MEIYEFEIVALVLFVFGLIVLTRNELEVTISAGPPKRNGFMNREVEYTKSEKFILGKTSTKVTGVVIILVSVFVYLNIKGDLAFVL